MLPIAVVILFSFNDPAGRFNYVWSGFTLDHWIELGRRPRDPRRARHLARDRHALDDRRDRARDADRDRASSGTASAVAERRTCSSSCRWRRPRSCSARRCSRCSSTRRRCSSSVSGTIFIAHVMFIVSYVVVTVKARLIGFDRHLEEAAMDLGANELDDLPQGHAAAASPRRCSPRRCSASRSRSTTS